MISFSTVSSANYYAEALEKDGNRQKSADNYYADGTSKSEWMGEATKGLGLKCQDVDGLKFSDILNGNINLPDGSSQQLNRASRTFTNKETGEQAVSQGRKGWDFTISAPKSVSIAGLVANDERVIDAHKDAVKATVKYIEENGAQTRIKEGKETFTVQTGNVIAAGFHHETSRENEPNLHTHTVIMNATYDKNSGQFRSLSNEKMMDLRKSADEVYKNELANNLKKLGYEASIEKEGEHNTIKIKGISEEHEKYYSTRSDDIEKFRNQMDKAVENNEKSFNFKGKNSVEKLVNVSEKDAQSWQKASDEAKNQWATIATRPPKSENSREQDIARWQSQAKDIKLDYDKLKDKALEKAQSKDVNSKAHESAKSAVKDAIKDLSKDKGSFNSRELMDKVIEKAKGNCSVKDIKEAIKSAKNNEELIDRNYGKMTTPGAIASKKEEWIKEQKEKDSKNPNVQKLKELSGKNKDLTEKIGDDYKKLSEAKYKLKQVEYKDGKDKNMFGLATKTRTQIYDANIKTGGIGFVKDRYMITDKGVFKSKAGVFSAKGIKNAIGHKLSDNALKQKQEANKEMRDAKASGSLAGIMKAALKQASADIKGSVGKSMTSWQKCGMAESAMARAGNAMQKAKDKESLKEQIKDLEKKIENKQAQREYNNYQKDELKARIKEDKEPSSARSNNDMQKDRNQDKSQEKSPDKSVQKNDKNMSNSHNKSVASESKLADVRHKLDVSNYADSAYGKNSPIAKEASDDAKKEMRDLSNKDIKKLDDGFKKDGLDSPKDLKDEMKNRDMDKGKQDKQYATSGKYQEGLTGKSPDKDSELKGRQSRQNLSADDKKENKSESKESSKEPEKQSKDNGKDKTKDVKEGTIAPSGKPQKGLSPDGKSERQSSGNHGNKPGQSASNSNSKETKEDYQAPSTNKNASKEHGKGDDKSSKAQDAGKNHANKVQNQAQSKAKDSEKWLEKGLSADKNKSKQADKGLEKDLSSSKNQDKSQNKAQSNNENTQSRSRGQELELGR